ncbi:restriction endonuclease [Streptomyces sp. NPDC018031]|uniref:restriction endonuclease n=1 Tax=Streptomyces sp. NPDC018031 TaxID=3365033 RepID=UPI0037AA5313
MAVPGRRPREERRPYAFGIRQLSLGFGLLAIVLCGAGLMLREAARAAEARPVAALLLGLLALPAAAAIGRRRRTVAAHPAVPPPAVPVPDAVPTPAAVPAATGPDPGPGAVQEVPADFSEMDAGEFEQAVAGLCERDGCRDVRVPGGAGDLGADVLATTPDGRRLVIQCKAYGPGHKVGSPDLQRFGGTCFAVHDAHAAVLVTTSEFTDPAAEYAAQCGIDCFDGRALTEWARRTGPPPWAQPG